MGLTFDGKVFTDGGSFDFPDNESGTLATREWALENGGGGTTGIKKYIALVTQTGTDAPVATVLENSLGGEVVWRREDVGQYYGLLAGAFPVAKTLAAGGNGESYTYARANDDEVTLATFTLLPSPGAIDDVINPNPVPLEILVYP